LTLLTLPMVLTLKFVPWVFIFYPPRWSSTGATVRSSEAFFFFSHGFLFLVWLPSFVLAWLCGSTDNPGPFPLPCLRARFFFEAFIYLSSLGTSTVCSASDPTASFLFVVLPFPSPCSIFSPISSSKLLVFSSPPPCQGFRSFFLKTVLPTKVSSVLDCFSS